MIQSYKKLLEMEAIVSLKLEQDEKYLEKIRQSFYKEKEFFIEKLISYLNIELGMEFFSYKVVDIDNNVTDILVKKYSNIFKEYIEDKESINFNIEELIDSRMFDNKNEIIIVDINSTDEFINMNYICQSLEYKYLSYSDKLKDKLEQFVDYLLNKNINNIYN